MSTQDTTGSTQELVPSLAHSQAKGEAIEIMRDWIEYEQEINSLAKQIRNLQQAQEETATQLVKLDNEMAQAFGNDHALAELMLIRGRDGFFYLFHMDRFDRAHSIEHMKPMIKKQDLLDAAE